MSILIDEQTRVLCQGITGSAGGLHATLCHRYGTRIVGGVTPGKGGAFFDIPAADSGGGFDGKQPARAARIPVFDSVADAVRETKANATMIFVPPPFAADAIVEAAEAGLRLVCCITEGIPVMDMIKVRQALKRTPECRLIGPNCPGVITPEACKIGIMPGYIHKKGDLGVLSRSGTLTYEAVWQITCSGWGQSSCVGIGGDPVKGADFIDILELFEKDKGTAGVLLIGEIGGSAEEEAAAWIKRNMRKPVAAFVAGRTAPPGRRMGHAGAIISGSAGTADGKLEALRAANVAICENPAEMAATLLRKMGRLN